MDKKFRNSSLQHPACEKAQTCWNKFRLVKHTSFQQKQASSTVTATRNVYFGAKNRPFYCKDLICPILPGSEGLFCQPETNLCFVGCGFRCSDIQFYEFNSMKEQKSSKLKSKVWQNCSYRVFCKTIRRSVQKERQIMRSQYSTAGSGSFPCIDSTMRLGRKSKLLLCNHDNYFPQKHGNDFHH